MAEYKLICSWSTWVFLGLLSWFEQIFCVCVNQAVRIRAFIFSAMLALGQALQLCCFWHGGERDVSILIVVVCLEFRCYDPSNYLNSTDLGVKGWSFFRLIQIKDCEISLLATQKLCHKKTTEIGVWNNYSIILVHECWCGHIELALRTVIQISGETEHGWKSQKKIQNMLPPHPPENWNYFEINFMTSRCCSHIPRRRRGKGKVDRLIPEVASASASAITAEQKPGSLCILPFHFPYFLFNRQGR